MDPVRCPKYHDLSGEHSVIKYEVEVEAVLKDEFGAVRGVPSETVSYWVCPVCGHKWHGWDWRDDAASARSRRNMAAIEAVW